MADPVLQPAPLFLGWIAGTLVLAAAVAPYLPPATVGAARALTREDLLLLELAVNLSAIAVLACWAAVDLGRRSLGASAFALLVAVTAAAAGAGCFWGGL